MYISEKAQRGVSVIIPTRNRPDSLSALLSNLSLMTDEFSRVIVVDSSGPEFRERVDRVIQDCRRLQGLVTVVHSPIASLTHQKNLGMNQCRADEIIQILDDDVLPPKGYLIAMKQLLLKSGLTGVSGVTQEMVPPSFAKRLFSRMFGLVSAKPGDVSVGGIGSPVYPNPGSDEPVHSSWLIGCSMWDLSKIEGARYHPRLLGSALFEDVEFSFRLSKVGLLAVDPTKVLLHQSATEQRPDSFTFWYRFSRNRFEVIKIRTEWPRAVLVWSTIGVLVQVVFGAERQKLKSVKGLMLGLKEGLIEGEFY
jgi:GT2 family glycosyltransferase